VGVELEGEVNDGIDPFREIMLAGVSLQIENQDLRGDRECRLSFNNGRNVPTLPSGDLGGPALKEVRNWAVENVAAKARPRRELRHLKGKMTLKGK
jgi:hypothetical protein